MLLAALTTGTTRIVGLLDSDDVQQMLNALTTLGVNWYRDETTQELIVVGMNGVPQKKQAKLFLGNGGIVYRLLTAALAVSNGDYELSGVPRMYERPIGDLVDALRQIGVDTRCMSTDDQHPHPQDYIMY